MEKIIVGHCPICNGQVLKTGRGYKCENAIGENPSCSFMLGSIICNRHMADSEISELLANNRILLDGFCSNEWKPFSSVLSIDNQGKTRIDAKVGKCPQCGGDVYAGLKAFSCSNYRNTEATCRFTVWRTYAGHMVSLHELAEILTTGITSSTAIMFAEDGTPYEKRLGLSPDKTQVIKS